MKNHFLIPYVGNKRNECDNIFYSVENQLENNVEIIVEPFCGSCAFSYYMSYWYPKKYKYVINDNNEFLIELIKIAKDKEKLNEVIEQLKEMHKDMTKEKYKIMKRVENQKIFINWLYINKAYGQRPGMYHMEKKFNFDAMKESPFINFLKNEDVTIMNGSWLIPYEKYKDNEKAFIFLDPPYLSSCNSYYSDPLLNVYEYMTINNINEEKACIVFCLEDMWIIRLLFKDYDVVRYSKRYEMTRKHTSHIIIRNKKCFE